MNSRARSYKGLQRMSSNKKPKQGSRTGISKHSGTKDKTKNCQSNISSEYFEKKTPNAHAKVGISERRDKIVLNSRNINSQLSLNKSNKHPTTPKYNIVKSKSRVSLLGQYTSSALAAKSSGSKPNLSKTSKHIMFPHSKDTNRSMYPLNVTVSTASINEYRGKSFHMKPATGANALN